MIELARRPGISAAAVALANGLNANMLRRWVKEAAECVPSSGYKNTAEVLPAFVQLPMLQEVPSALPPAPAQSSDSVSVEIRRGNTMVQAELPLNGSSAAWLREVLS